MKGRFRNYVRICGKVRYENHAEDNEIQLLVENGRCYKDAEGRMVPDLTDVRFHPHVRHAEGWYKGKWAEVTGHVYSGMVITDYKSIKFYNYE